MVRTYAVHRHNGKDITVHRHNGMDNTVHRHNGKDILRFEIRIFIETTEQGTKEHIYHIVHLARF